MKFALLINQNRRRALVKCRDIQWLSASVVNAAVYVATYRLLPDIDDLQLERVHKNTINLADMPTLHFSEVPVANVIRAYLPCGVYRQRLKFRIGFYTDEGFILPSNDYVNRYSDVEYTRLRHG